MILKRRNVEVVATERDEIDRLRAEGFEPIFMEPEEMPKTNTTPLIEYTVKELRGLAAARGIKYSTALRKQELIELLEENDD